LYQTRGLGNKQREKAEELLEWTLQSMELLHILSEKLAMTIQAFTRFESDKGYFLDIRDGRTRSTLDSLQETFERLLGLQKKLTRLERSCDQTERIVSKRLNNTGNTLTWDRSNFSWLKLGIDSIQKPRSTLARPTKSTWLLIVSVNGWLYLTAKALRPQSNRAAQPVSMYK
jgi:hypothetical protein